MFYGKYFKITVLSFGHFYIYICEKQVGSTTFYLLYYYVHACEIKPYWKIPKGNEIHVSGRYRQNKIKNILKTNKNNGLQNTSWTTKDAPALKLKKPVTSTFKIRLSVLDQYKHASYSYYIISYRHDIHLLFIFLF